MKQILKAILVLLLILGILGGSIWFFFFYRSDLTQSALCYWGDHCFEKGRYNRAVFFYSAAVRLTPTDTWANLRLAESYVQEGNYSKAEYTLVSAITQMPDSVPLYAALSGTYVAQDKLLDAEQMLDRISNTEVKRQIDELRPSTPIITPESGYYSEYIEVSVLSGSGTLYAALNKDYPSVTEDRYTAPFRLDGGITKVIAISVGENGLVSDAAYAGYTVGNVVEPAEFADPVIEGYVRELLGTLPGDVVMTDELWEIDTLELPEGVTDLSDLNKFAGLRSLKLCGAIDLNYDVLGTLSTLESLDLSGSTLSFSVLETISLLPDLKALDLSECAVSRIDPLVGLTKLETLDLANNTVSDITALSNLSSLKELRLSNNPIKSISQLASCTALEKLYIENCNVSKLTGLAETLSLRELHAAGNSIENAAVLEGCINLEVLDIPDNQVSDIAFIAGLPKLRELIASNNKITEIPEIDVEAPLWNVNLNQNQVADVSGLKDMKFLNYLYIDYNQVHDIGVLKGCLTLTQIDAWDNPLDLSVIPEMQENGIIVHYNPNYTPPAEETTNP